MSDDLLSEFMESVGAAEEALVSERRKVRSAVSVIKEGDDRLRTFESRSESLVHTIQRLRRLNHALYKIHSGEVATLDGFLEQLQDNG